MSTIHFWEKPGCRTNARQKIALQAAGHELIVHDLLGEPWTPQRLLDFFADLPLAQWFNQNAPQVKSGEIVPERFDTGSALRAMIKTPILIRRPLIEVGDTRIAGFNPEQLHDLIGLAAATRAGEACSGDEAACGG